MNRTSAAILVSTLAIAVIIPAGPQAAGPVGTFAVAEHPIIVTPSSLRAKATANRSAARARMVALVDESFSERALVDAGWRVISRTGDVVTLEGDAATACYLGALPGIRCTKIASRVYPQLDSARKVTNVDQVHGTRSGGSRRLTGKKVLLGVIDTEFDTRHPAFLDSNGDSRFVAIWDQDDTSHTIPNRFGYGIIKNTQQILADSLFALDSNNPHGTMSMSLAAGSDKRYWKGSPDNSYYGMAPDAILAGVKMGGDDVSIIDGLNWLFTLADDLRLPCVVNMSLGYHDGPHDGTSLVDRAIDNHSKSPGHIVVGAAGNDGDKRAHIAFTVGRNESKGAFITPVLGTNPAGAARTFSGIEMWGEAGKSFSATFFIIDTVKRTWRLSTRSISTSTITPIVQYKPDTVVWIDPGTNKRDTVIFQIWTERASVLNGKPHLQAAMAGTNPVLFTGVNVAVAGNSGGTVHAWNLQKQSFESFGIPGFYGGDSTTSINELGGTSFRNITVGAYESNLRTVFWDGTVKDWGADPLNPHKLAGYTSFGPTVDGRIKPDITAPGSNLTCAFPRKSQITSVVVWPDTNSLAGRYIASGGTSVASPVVAGIVAMLLEADPKLSYEKARTLLKETAINDVATGTIGLNYNNKWGGGKVNALAAVNKLLGVPNPVRTTGADFQSPPFSIVKMAGNRLRIVGRRGKSHAGIVLEIYSVDGRCAGKRTVAKDGRVAGTLDYLPGGYYFVRAVERGKSLCSTGITVVE